MAGKREHYVPVLHLKQFCDAEQRIWTYDATDGSVRCSSPEDTAVEKHFYSPQKDDGTYDKRVDDVITLIEGEAQAPYERLLAGELPNGQAKMDFAHYLGTLHVRTPTMRRLSAEILSTNAQLLNYAHASDDTAFESLIAEAEEERGQKMPPETRAKVRAAMLNPKGYAIDVAKDATLPVIGAADQIGELLYKMNWCVVQLQRGYLITSDNPVVRFAPLKSIHPVYGDGGFKNPQVEVTFPLSRTSALLMMSRALPGRIVAPRAQVDRLNRGRAQYSERYLYAHIADNRVRRLSKEFAATRPKAIIQSGVGPKQFAATNVVRRIVRPK